MKKFLLSMAVMVSAMTASAATSFTLTNAHNNEPIANGATITVTEFDEDFGMAEFEYDATPDSYPASFQIWLTEGEMEEWEGQKAIPELCWRSGAKGNCLPNMTEPTTVTVDEKPLTGQIHMMLPNDDVNAKIKSTVNCFVKLNDTTVEFSIVFDNRGAGVASTIADENAPAEYYTIDGVRVANPANGLYIVKQGSKVRKVMMK